MTSLLSSRKGITSAPFLVIVSAIIMVATITIVFPYLQSWTDKINEGRAMKETLKLRNALNEIHAMSDVGSIEKVIIDLPPGYTINIEGRTLRTSKDANFNSHTAANGDFFTLEMDAKADPYISAGAPDKVFGTMVLELKYGTIKKTKNFQIGVG